MASLQLSQVLDRLEEDEERQQGVLQQRIDAERAELKVTMSFSRAAAVASVEQEVALREAREAKPAREQEAPAVEQKASAVECLSPELAREDASSRDRLAGEKKRLKEEVSALRVQVERLSTASASVGRGSGEGGVASTPSSPADGRRPAVDDTAMIDANNATASESNAKRPAMDETAVTDANNATSYKSNSAGGASDGDVGVGGSSGRSGGEGADANNATSSESNGGDGGASEENVGDGGSSGGRGGGEGALTRRLVEAETERVLEELRADPPASTRALLLARAEMEARTIEVVAKLNATGLLPPPPPLPTALHEDLGL